MILSIVVCVIFFLAVLIWLWRFAGEVGFNMPNFRFSSFIYPKAKTIEPGVITSKENIYIFCVALLFRIAVFFLAWAALGIFQGGNDGSLSNFLEHWNIWDAHQYTDIAQGGYSVPVPDGRFLYLVFFPLYPALIRLFFTFIRNYLISGLIISFLSYAFGCVIVYNLVNIDYGKAVARKSLIYLSLFPFAYYYGAIMTESLFFLLTVATFYAIRKHNWLLTGILGMFAALCRSFGVFLIIPAAVEWLQTVKPITLIRDKKLKQLGIEFVKFLPAILMIIGILVYLYINYATAGDPFIFLQYEKDNWSQGIQYFGKTIKNVLWDYIFVRDTDLSLKMSIFVPGLINTVLFALITLYSSRRTRSMYVAFMLVYFLFNVGSSWPISLSRYLSCMFPAFWVTAELTEKHKKLDVPLIALMAICYGIYLAGYITKHQIM